MNRKIILTLFLLLLLNACVKVSGETPKDAPVLFVTSTLPPYKPGLTLPTPVPPTASPTSDPLTPRPTPTCHDSAVFVEDVTYPDNTSLKAGEKFTKTWKLQNTGTCKWTNYTVAFVSGDKMEASDSVPETERRFLAAELKTLAAQLEELTRAVEGSNPTFLDPGQYRTAAA